MNEIILWEMAGKRQNDKIEWKAMPKVVEMMDEHKFLFYGGCGGSIGLIGKYYFTSKEECEQNFLRKHGGFVETIGFDEPTPKGVDELERTDFQTLQVVDFDTVNQTSVYLGGLRNLQNITKDLFWHKEYVEGLEMEVGTLTLSEIWEYVKSSYNNQRIVTVFVDSTTHGDIYQCGNYEEGKWVKLGETQGYW